MNAQGLSITDPSRASTPTQGPSTTPLPTNSRRLCIVEIVMERIREYVSAPEGLRPLRIVVATGATAVAMAELSIQPVSAQPTDSEYAPECTYAREPHWQNDSNQDGQPGPGSDEFVCLNKPGCYDVSIVPNSVLRELEERGQLDGGDGWPPRRVILLNESLGGAVGACNGDSPLTRRDFQRVFEEHPWLTDVLENNPWVTEATARRIEDTYSVSSQNIRKLSWISIHNLDEDTEIPEGVSQPENTEDTDSTQAEVESTESESNTDPVDTEIPEGVSQPENTEDTDSTQAEVESTESESNTDPVDTEIPEGVSQPENTEDTDSTQAEVESTESESNTDPVDTEIPEGVSQPENTEDTDSTQAEVESTESESNTDPVDTEIPEGVSQPENTEDTDSTQAEPTTTSLGIMEQSPRQEVVAEVALSPIDSPADNNLPEIAIGITTAAIALGALTLFFKNRRKSTKNS